jgi:hypothetical protein
MIYDTKSSYFASFLSNSKKTPTTDEVRGRGGARGRAGRGDARYARNVDGERPMAS